MSEWLAGSTPSGMPNWLVLIIGLVVGVPCVALLIWAKVEEWRSPVRRGAPVEFQTAAVVARYRRGEVGKDETLAEMTRLRTKPRFRD